MCSDGSSRRWAACGGSGRKRKGADAVDPDEEAYLAREEAKDELIERTSEIPSVREARDVLDRGEAEDYRDLVERIENAPAWLVGHVEIEPGPTTRARVLEAMGCLGALMAGGDWESALDAYVAMRDAERDGNKRRRSIVTERNADAREEAEGLGFWLPLPSEYMRWAAEGDRPAFARACLWARDALSRKGRVLQYVRRRKLCPGAIEDVPANCDALLRFMRAQPHVFSYPSDK